jgi:ribonuclease P protein component
MNERLRPEERIRRKKDFIGLYKSGRRFRARYFNVVYRPNGLEASRLAVVVSRKVGPAVARNRIKRRVRDLFRRNKPLLAEPTDLIVVARPGIMDCAPGDLASDYFAALRAIGRQRTLP